MFHRMGVAGAVVLLALGPIAGGSVTSAGAATPAEVQFAWLVAASARPPLSAPELRRHLDAGLLGALGGADGFNRALRPYMPFTAGAVLSSSNTELRQVVTGPRGPLMATVDVDPAGLVSHLLLSPYLPAPASWAAVHSELRTLAPRVSFAAARITPAGCRVVDGTNATLARPMGSAFKLYVLGALAQAIHSGRLSWNTRLALHPAWKSLPSGVLQDQPGGTVYTLAQYADYMISISDNTAADHLIHEVGRDAVQRQFTIFGNTAPNAPLLTTRELFALKSWDYPAAATAYAALPAPGRAATLPALDRVPLSAITGWTGPEMIDTLEWFGSPIAMCRAFAGLWAQHDPHVTTVLTLNDGGLGLPAARFPTVWFKGGAEPGVLTLNYLARTADGALVSASLMLSDPNHPLDESTIDPPALALLRGAIQLTAR